ncbi:hypothetical protein BJ742DRAFT_381703 [Cladochytrium replicatum]|nr:hypothetical protein BJ742DRAFT_381703 [Cladochytrium replicatum]
MSSFTTRMQQRSRPARMCTHQLSKVHISTSTSWSPVSWRPPRRPTTKRLCPRRHSHPWNTVTRGIRIRRKRGCAVRRGGCQRNRSRCTGVERGTTRKQMRVRSHPRLQCATLKLRTAGPTLGFSVLECGVIFFVFGYVQTFERFVVWHCCFIPRPVLLSCGFTLRCAAHFSNASYADNSFQFSLVVR